MKSVFAGLSLSAVAAELYCPSEEDLTIAYTDPHAIHEPLLQDQGWIIMGGGGVASQAAFNLLGGYVEFDIDLSGVKSGVNANVYAISPEEFKYGHFHKKSDYCDGAQTGKDFCLEVDWVEANGHCGAAMTIHAIEGPGNGCTAWGCRSSYDLKSTKYHFHIEYDTQGHVTVSRNGHVIPDLYPTPGGDIWAKIRDINRKHGSVIYSSEWIGWVPREGCGTNGDLHSSAFSVSNLQIKGSVVQGPKPRVCKSAGRRRRRTAPAKNTRRRRSRANCASDTEDCRSARCCKDSGKTCYEKDAGWASCRDTGSCKAGQVNPYDPPNARTPWTCRPITSSMTSMSNLTLV
jgi:hypothetical protein